MKYSKAFWYFFSSILFSILVSCTKSSFHNFQVNSKYITISDSLDTDEEIASFLAPYQQHIATTLSKKLAYNPQNLDKSSDKWQNSMTNFYADAILEMAQPIFFQRTGKHIDFCLLNYGGIRATMAQGDITTKTAYNIMPFENNAVVLELSANSIKKMCNFIIENKTAHPLSNICIVAQQDNLSIKNIYINNQLLDDTKNYLVVTNDYLAKGGDKMTFLTEAIHSYPLDFKLRNMFIEYFTKIDTLKPSTTPRIIFE